MAQRIPTVIDNQLQATEPGREPIVVGASEWFAWLDHPQTRSFSYQTADGAVTVRRERKRQQWYWYAYSSRHHTLHKVYLGKTAELSAARLAEAAARLSRSAAAPTIRLRLLGPPLIDCNEQPVTLTAAKALALLTYLAAQPQPQSRERLLALLWPESSEEAARKNLRNTLWQIRTALGDAVIQGEQRLAIHEDVWIDLRVFLRAHDEATRTNGSRAGYQTMLRLWRGPLLEGLTLHEAPEFELWLTTERERLHELHLHTLHELAGIYRTAGRWRDVARVARRALALDPLQEPMHQALIEAHARRGDRAAALRQYDSLRAVLDRELGVEPLAQTEQLREAALNGDLLSAAPATPDLLATAAAHADKVRQPFIGRDEALAIFDQTWAQIQAGRARVVLLLGEAGIGKSRLWETWADRIGSVAPVLATGCLPATQHLPFAPLIELLRGPTLRARLATLARLTPPLWLTDIVRVAPELADTLPAVAPPTRLSPAEEQRRVFEALVQGLSPTASQPLILFIDDLHWADQATLDWLVYLLHRARDLPLLLVAACRPDETDSLTALIASWERAGQLVRIALDRLSRSESQALVTALGGDLERIDALYAQSAGNPYFLIELLHAEPGSVPATITELIAQRLTQLSDVTRQVIQAAAVLQPEISFALLQRTSGRGDDETLDALDTLLRAGLLVEHGGRYAFGHPLVGHVVEGSLGEARRRILHRRAAATWEQTNAARLPAVAGYLARHYQEAGEAARAARYAELAGAHALDVAAPAEAEHFYAQAAALEATPARLYGLGIARYRRSNPDGARDALMAAEQACLAQDDRVGAARAALEIARSYRATGQVDAVVVWVQRGLADLKEVYDPATQALAAYLLGANERAAGGSLTAAADWLSEARELAAAGYAPDLLPGILIELGNAYAEQGELPSAIACYHELIEHAQTAKDELAEVIGYNNAAYHSLLAGDLAAARTLAERGIALATQYDLPLAEQWLASTRGEIALAEDDPDTAESWFQRGMQTAGSYGNTAQVAGYKANLARVARARGQLDAARSWLEDARTDITALTAPYLQAQLDLWLAELHIAQGEHHAAQALVEQVEQRAESDSFRQIRTWLVQLREELAAAAR
jgi:DNA-binding SARP family transcriptional activator